MRSVQSQDYQSDDYKCFWWQGVFKSHVCGLLFSPRREQQPAELRRVDGHDVPHPEVPHPGRQKFTSCAPGRLQSGDQAETGWRGRGEDEERLMVGDPSQAFTFPLSVFNHFMSHRDKVKGPRSVSSWEDSNSNFKFFFFLIFLFIYFVNWGGGTHDFWSEVGLQFLMCSVIHKD